MSDRYLVSFCNNEAKLCLATVSPQGIERTVELDLDGVSLKGGGLTGICIDGDRVLVGLQSRPPAVLVLDREYKLTSVLTLDGAADVHGIAILGSEIIIVSTGTNQVLAVDRSAPADPRIIWDDRGPCVDREHLNDLHLTPDGRLLMCRFGAPYPERMRSGSVVEVATGKVLIDGLREPHSPYWMGSSLYVLDSATGDLIRVRAGFSPQRIAGILGYARGLVIDADRIVIGKSGYRGNPRRRLGDDRSAPIATTHLDAGLLGRSGVYFIERDGNTVNWVETTACGAEIYQILPLDDDPSNADQALLGVTGAPGPVVADTVRHLPGPKPTASGATTGPANPDPRFILVEASDEVEFALLEPLPGFGWHAAETTPTGYHRWTGPEPRFSLELFLPEEPYICWIVMKSKDLRNFDNFSVTINDDNVPYDHHITGDGTIHLRFDVPGRVSGDHSSLDVIIFRHASVSRPDDWSDEDDRLLGFCVTSIAFVRAAPRIRKISSRKSGKCSQMHQAPNKRK